MGINSIPWLDNQGELRLDELQIRAGRLVTGEPRIGDLSALSGQLERVIVPGYIDAHVHFRQPGQAYKEGIANGCLAAFAGGVTTVLDMPNTVPPTCGAAALKAKRRLWAARSRVGWGLFVGYNNPELTPSNHGRPGFVKDSTFVWHTPASLNIDPSRIAALKVFMARSGACAALTDPEHLATLMLNWHRIAVHAEDETAFPSVTTGLSHDERRPRSAVISALKKLERAFEIAGHRLGRVPDCRLILLHLAAREEVEWVRRMKDRGYDLVAETCPHYLYFTNEDLAEYGAQIQVNPPLRDAEDQAALWQGLADGTIDMVNSDHAPHTTAEKASANPPSGIPGIERMWPLLASAADAGRISWRRALALAGQNAAHCYGLLDRGELVAGARADLVVLRRNNATDSALSRKIVTGAGYDAYRHLKFPWEIERVLIAGQTAWEQSTARAVPLAEEVYAAKSSC